jgi:hypothetical protein
MQSVILAFGKAIWSQLHLRMLLLTVMPFVISVTIWGIGLYFGLQPLIDWMMLHFANHDIFRIFGNVLSWFGLESVRAVLVPLIALFLLLPLMILTALVFVGTMAMPAITKFVGQRAHPELEQRHGGSFWGSAWISLRSFVVFLVLWIVTLPLNAIPPLTFIVQPLLWGWLTCRVMSYEALAEHASAAERREILRSRRWPLLMIGTIAGAMGAAPTLLWLGGALTIVLFPLLAALSIWLYVLVFVFSGLWFQHYCLDALLQLRRAATMARADTAASAATATPDYPGARSGAGSGTADGSTVGPARLAPGAPAMKDINAPPGA